jgi:hypothetical protein
MNALPDSLERLVTRMDALERRVYVLEHPSEEFLALPAAQATPLMIPESGGVPTFSLAGGAFPILGKAMLGIAGAYLLRAVAESNTFPRLAVAAIAIAYAMLWLIWAARVPIGAWFAGITYAGTSSLILAPMLWELTLRFNVFPAAATASVLGGYVCVATSLAWKRSLTLVLWVSNLAAAVVALALSIATHEMLPFIAVLLLMVLVSELAGVRREGLSVRPLVATVADVAIWGMIFIYSGPPSAREAYPALGMAALLAPGLTLFLICGASAVLKTAWLGRKVTVYETIQTTIAFSLAASSLLCFAPRGGAVVLGILCLALCAASYAIVFAIFLNSVERRNERVFSIWSAALFVTGAILCLPLFWLALCLSAGAILATFVGARLRRVAFEYHGVVFLIAAAWASGLMAYASQALAGTASGAPAWSVGIAAACAILCYAVPKSRVGESWSQQVIDLVLASIAIVAAVALLVESMVGVIALRAVPGAHHLAFIRTLTICAAALALAYSGAHWRRMELTRIGYATLVLVAAKLLLEDLRHGHLAFIAASIFLFAITLIAVPRLARMGQQTGGTNPRHQSPRNMG